MEGRMTKLGGVQGPIDLPKFEANGIKAAIDTYITSEKNQHTEEGKKKALETILNTLEASGIHKNKLLAQKTIDTVLERLGHPKNETQAEAIALLGSALSQVIPDTITQEMRRNFESVLRWREGDILPAKILAEQIFSKKVVPKEAKIAQKERVSSLGAAIVGKLASAKQTIAKAITPRSTKVEKSSEEAGTPETKVKKSTSAMSKIARKLGLGGVRGEQKPVVVEPKWASKEAPKTAADLVMKFNCLFLKIKQEQQELLRTELKANSPLRKALSENPGLLEAALATTTRALEATGKGPISLQREMLNILLDISDNNRQLKIDPNILQRARNALSA
jgi:SHS2 domain-containing protein